MAGPLIPSYFWILRGEPTPNPPPPPVYTTRITEDGKIRITEDGKERITE